MAERRQRRIILGVTGGIAAYKACDLASRLVREGASVRVVMTESAKRFVQPLTFAAITGQPVPDDWFDAGQESAIGHIDLARWAELVLVAPATANTIAKVATGQADNLLTAILLATRAPILMAPAMNPAMYDHPATKNNLGTLALRGVYLEGPGLGRTACGEEGRGRLAEVDDIAERAWDVLAPKDLAGVSFLVTAGPTREHLDPVRYISNPSTGRMGIEVARHAARRGAEVCLVLGPTALKPPPSVRTVHVTSAEEMAAECFAEAERAHVIVKTAAVSDFRPEDCAAQKVKKSGKKRDVCMLVGTTDILATLGENKEDRILVGFAAETEDIVENARAKLMKKQLDLLVANDVTRPDSGFAVDTNLVQFLTIDGGIENMPLLTKADVSRYLLDKVVALLDQKRQQKKRQEQADQS